MSETKEYPIDRFLQWVTELVQRDDRGTLAELRRGLSETTQDQAWEHLIPYSADFAENADHRVVWCAIGGLAAMLVPCGLSSSEPWNNIGTTMRALAKGGGENDDTFGVTRHQKGYCGEGGGLPHSSLAGGDDLLQTIMPHRSRE